MSILFLLSPSLLPSSFCLWTVPSISVFHDLFLHPSRQLKLSPRLSSSPFGYGNILFLGLDKCNLSSSCLFRTLLQKSLLVPIALSMTPLSLYPSPAPLSLLHNHELFLFTLRPFAASSPSHYHPSFSIKRLNPTSSWSMMPALWATC